jgi:hypothetical protein
MSIEVGGRYRVTASNKKSYVEECVWAKGSFKSDDYVSVMISEVFRNGTYIITPLNAEECEMLEGSSYADDDDVFEFEAFEDVEFEECYDGCSNDYEFEGVDEEEEDRILDGLSECVFADDFMREEGFDDIEYRTYIIGPVDVESV